MKKILIAILIILLAVMAYSVVTKGLSIGSLQVLSVSQIQEENDNLDQEIYNTQVLMYSTYADRTASLESSIDSLLEAKKEYEDLVNISTESEIAEATTQETYTVEYLWTTIGSYATSEGVTLKLDIVTGDSGNLSFTIAGSYVAVINFITDIEDDSNLGFRIQNFKMSAGGDSSSREATFSVYNVRIEQEVANTSSSSSVTSTTSTATTDITETTETEDTVETSTVEE